MNSRKRGISLVIGVYWYVACNLNMHSRLDIWRNAAIDLYIYTFDLGAIYGANLI